METAEETRELVMQTSTGEYTFFVEIADNKEQRVLGLMHRESLDDDKGMLFVYEEEHVPAFWMKNMKISLDMIFMNKDFEVVDYFENVPPCDREPCERYKPISNSQYVLEVPAGTINKIELTKGDVADFDA